MELDRCVFRDDYFGDYEIYELESLETFVGLIEQGDVESIKGFKKHEPEIFQDTIEEYGGILLKEAIRHEQFEIADYLLNHKCSTKTGYEKTSPIHHASKNPNATSLLRQLLFLDSDVSKMDRFGNTPLHWACRMGVGKNVEILVEHGAQCDVKNISNETPLHLAVYHSHVECVRLLLEAATDANARTSDELSGHTPIDYGIAALFNTFPSESVVLVLRAFCSSRSSSAVEILHNLKSSGILDDSKENESNKSFVSCDQVESKLQIVDLLVKFCAEFDILVSAAKYIDADHIVDCIRLLVKEFGRNINEKGYLRYTALHFILERKMPFEVLKYLVDLGADVNAVSINGLTPLEMSVRRSNIPFARLLLENGANANFVKDDGWSPLIHALRIEDFDLAKLLVEHGADTNIRELQPRQFTPLMDILKRPPYSVKSVELLLELGADVNAKDSSLLQSTPLHMVAQCSQYDEETGLKVMEMLSEAAENIDPRDSHGFTPLMRALTVKHFSVEMVILLLEFNADPTVVSNDNQTPLSLAINHSIPDAVTLFMEYDLNFNVKQIFDSPASMTSLIKMNIPYQREELFAVRKFHCCEGINKQRRVFVESFVREKFPDCSQDVFNNLTCSLYEMFRGSAFERKFCCTITNGLVALFIEAENYLLQTKGTSLTNERLKELLEYRLEICRSDNYLDALKREIRAMESHIIQGTITLYKLLRTDVYNLATILKNVEINSIVADLSTQYSNEFSYPIMSAVIKKHLQDGLGRLYLLRGAASAINSMLPSTTLPSCSLRTLPEHIVDQILSHLPDSDLRNLIFLHSELNEELLYDVKVKWWDRLNCILEEGVPHH